jgi:hypothetical protein
VHRAARAIAPRLGHLERFHVHAHIPTVQVVTIIGAISQKRFLLYVIASNKRLFLCANLKNWTECSSFIPENSKEVPLPFARQSPHSTTREFPVFLRDFEVN